MLTTGRDELLLIRVRGRSIQIKKTDEQELVPTVAADEQELVPTVTPDEQELVPTETS